MTRKVLSLEEEVKDLKNKSITNATIQDLKKKVAELYEEKETEKQKGRVDKSCDFNHDDIKESSSTPKDKTDKVEKTKVDSEMLKCKEYNYECKKEKTLKNHTLTKHDHHQCKECQQKLPNFMQLLKHIAVHHKDEEVPKERAEGKDLETESGSSASFDESFLDEFLEEKEGVV